MTQGIHNINIHLYAYIITTNVTSRILPGFSCRLVGSNFYFLLDKFAPRILMFPTEGDFPHAEKCSFSQMFLSSIVCNRATWPVKTNCHVFDPQNVNKYIRKAIYQCHNYRLPYPTPCWRYAPFLMTQVIWNIMKPPTWIGCIAEPMIIQNFLYIFNRPLQGETC